MMKRDAQNEGFGTTRRWRSSSQPAWYRRRRRLKDSNARWGGYAALWPFKQKARRCAKDTRLRRDDVRLSRHCAVANASTVIPAQGARWFRDQRQNNVALNLTRSKLFTSSLPVTSRHTPVWVGGTDGYGHRKPPTGAELGSSATNNNAGGTPGPAAIGCWRGRGEIPLSRRVPEEGAVHNKK